MTKKIFCLILAIISGFTFSGLTAIAASPSESNYIQISGTDNSIIPYASGSNSRSYDFTSGVPYTDKIYLGANPTITFKVTGNPNLHFGVTITTPVGTEVVFEPVLGNGTTITKKVTSIISGNFHFTIRPYSGSSYGQTVTAVVSGTW